jgi:hypothetical protein
MNCFATGAVKTILIQGHDYGEFHTSDNKKVN